jgi:HIV Tat-specific factor 1
VLLRFTFCCCCCCCCCVQVNTSVYVTGLPDDTDVDEVAQHFARCGIIRLDDAGQPRIKLYT